MNKTELMSKMNRSFNKAALQLKKHSPEILVAAGIVGGVASAVLACKATTKVSGILEDTKAQVDAIHDVVENPEKYNAEYTEEDSKKDLAIVYAQTGMKLAKIYGPAVMLGTVSVISILAGHNILRKRYVATAAAYVAIDKSFKEYRGRVIDRFGKELDRELRYNIKAVEVEETVVDEKGKEKTVKKTVQQADPNAISDYARFFDETCAGFVKGNPSYNLMFLRQQQNYANDLLKSRGHVFLNEVHDMLGIQRTPIGAVVGWIYDPSNQNIDSFIDFGIYDPKDADKRAFVNGLEPAILLDFNCDGPIYELI